MRKTVYWIEGDGIGPDVQMCIRDSFGEGRKKGVELEGLPEGGPPGRRKGCAGGRRVTC